MRDGDIIRKRNRELLSELLEISEEVFAARTLREIMIAPQAIKGIGEAVVHPREVFQAAIYYSAAAVILVHNHPSGDPSPSNPDKKVTKRIFQCGKIMEIPVLDHVIIGNLLFYSFKEDKIQSLTY